MTTFTEKLDASQTQLAKDYLNQEIHRPEWDCLAAIHSQDALPTETDSRLAGIASLSESHFNLREKWGKLQGSNGAERQDLDLSLPIWEEMLGLPGITDPTSDVSQELLGIYREFGLLDPSFLEPAVQPKAIVALGCFGVSLLHRVQVQHGLQPTYLQDNGNYEPQAVADPTASSALSSSLPVRITLASQRPLMTKRGEHTEIAPLAPEARTEFDIALAASRLTLGSYTEEQHKLLDVGYTVDGEEGFLVLQQTDDKLVVNVCAPRPLRSERGRAQTFHSYMAMRAAIRHVSDIVDTPLLPEDSTVAIVTNADYGLFQKTAAVNAMIGTGWAPEMVTFTASRTNVARFITHTQLRLLPEIHSHVRQLTALHSYLRSS